MEMSTVGRGNRFPKGPGFNRQLLFEQTAVPGTGSGICPAGAVSAFRFRFAEVTRRFTGLKGPAR